MRAHCFLLAVVIVLSGCASLRGAGSMRIDVEVYKGPLSKELDVQWAELRGVVNDVHATLLDLQRFLEPIVGAPTDSSNLKNATRSHDETAELLKISERVKHNINAQPFEGALLSKSRSLGSSIEEAKLGDIRKTLSDASELAVRLKLSGLYRAFVGLSNPSWSRDVRNASVRFSVAVSQYANQLEYRADALLKQVNGEDRDVLAQSVYLRDAQPLELLNLYAWYRAGGNVLPEEILFHPIVALSTEEITDRVRIMERLLGDNYWSNINTVYASGQGDVAMAFIRDDIGNWNLKSFGNKPGELLDAYKEAGSAILAEAVELAKKGAFGGVDPTRYHALLQTANRFALGGEASATEDGTTSLNVKVFRTRTESSLRQLQMSAKDQEGAIITKAKELESKAADLMMENLACKGSSSDLNVRAKNDINAVRVLTKLTNAKLKAFSESSGPAKKQADVASDLNKKAEVAADEAESRPEQDDAADLPKKSAATADEIANRAKTDDTADSNKKTESTAVETESSLEPTNGPCEKAKAAYQALRIALAAEKSIEAANTYSELVAVRQKARQEALRILQDQEVVLDVLSESALSASKKPTP